jgi:ribonuclease D
MIGFDTETRPSFRAGVSYKVGLLQLSTPDTCYLIRLSHIRLDNRILKILGSRQILKVGADVSGDIRALHALRNFNADGFVDLQVEASRWGIEEKSLRKLSAIVLNKRVSKAQRLSNWEAESLTPQQQEYAATDAWICPEILKELQRVEPKAEPYTIISVMPTPSTSQPQQRHKARHHRRRAHHHSSNKQHIE